MKENKELFYKLCLFACALIWGSTFVIIKDTTNTMSAAFINAGRFTIGAIILFLVYFKKIKKVSKAELKHGIMMGVALFGGYYLQVLGMEYGSTAGKCAFLSSTFCVMVPFLTWGCFKKKPDKYCVAAAIICLVGVALISIENDSIITIGDGIILISTFFYAVNIMMTAEFSNLEGHDSTVLAFLQIAVVAVIGWVVVIAKNEFPPVYTTNAVLGVVYLGVFATALCLLLEVVALAKVNSTSGSIILSLESVFGVIISILFYNEVLTLRLAAGFSIIFIGIIICETKLSFIKDKISLGRKMSVSK